MLSLTGARWAQQPGTVFSYRDPLSRRPMLAVDGLVGRLCDGIEISFQCLLPASRGLQTAIPNKAEAASFVPRIYLSPLRDRQIQTMAITLTLVLVRSNWCCKILLLLRLYPLDVDAQGWAPLAGTVPTVQHLLCLIAIP